MIKSALILAAGGVLALAGCAEREQTATGIKSDTQAFQGTNRAAFTAPGWKPGDRNNWEQALKVRTVQGQNDYAKVP